MESKENKVLNFLSNMKDKAKDAIKDVKNSIASKVEKDKLEKHLEEVFNCRTTCQKIICVTNLEKMTGFKVVLDVDYNLKTLTLYGENAKIHKDCVFVDKGKQVFQIRQIRYNQLLTINVDEESYERNCTIFDYTIDDSKETAEKVNTIINIYDSEIKNSEISGTINEK